MHKYYPLIIMLSLVFCVAVVYATAETPDKKTTTISDGVSGITDENKDNRVLAAQSLLSSRDTLIVGLLSIAKQPEKKGVLYSGKELAIELLGTYRATEAVPVLIENIKFQTAGKTLELVVAGGYPCVKALANIGTPSLTGIVNRLSKPATETELKLFATVFRLVDGDELAILRAELALKKAEGQQKKNLEQLVELLKTKQWYF